MRESAPIPATTAPQRPRLTFAQILNMNVGFFGIQYSFGLQQSNMSPIYRYLGAGGAGPPGPEPGAGFFGCAALSSPIESSSPTNPP